MDTVVTWVQAISQLLGITLRYTERLHRILVTRAKHLRYQSRKVRGGVQRRKFYDRKWSFVAETVLDTTLKKENEHLKEKVEVLQSKLYSASNVIKSIQGGKVAYKKRTMSECEGAVYSERHLRRLKKSRTQSCEASLTWLGQQQAKPLNLEIFNYQKGKKVLVPISEVDDHVSVSESDEERVTIML